MNLITNSAQAIAEKDLGEDEKKGLIQVSTRANNGKVIVEVTDTGTGIPIEISDRVFDPFFTTKEVGKGTGQGLAISYDVIVNKHGGDIFFESRPGQGTTFTIRLPLEAVEEEFGG